MKPIASGMCITLGAIVFTGAVASAADCGGKGGAGVPCSCGDTVIADRTLTASDPVVSADPSQTCPFNGLTVADGVMLDLGGLVIRGRSVFDGIILGAGSVVKNGKIRDFGLGVFAPAAGTIIKGINLAGTDNGIATASSAVIVGNTIRDDCGYGIQAGDGSTVSDNNVQRCNVAGITCGSNVTVARNSVRFGLYGIIMEEGSGHDTFRENNISDNAVGIVESPNPAGGNSFLRNRVNRNSQSGGLTVASGNNAFLGNGASDNAGNGIDAHDPSNIDDGSNTGSGNGGPVQCEIGGSLCK